MISMGSAAYPGENYFEQFLEDNAGDSNASTDFENTNYFFTVEKDSLKKGLDIFSKFFVSPLFKATSVQREMQAVHSEFSKDQQDDEWRLLQVFQTTCRTHHPFTYLQGGNLLTLDKPGIREAVAEFFETHYSANLMTLAVLSEHSLDQLEQWVRDLFSLVPNKSLAALALPPAMDPTHLSTLTFMVPVKCTRQLVCVWVFEATAAHYKTKPLEFISSLLEHEGKNSLYSGLRSLQLATKVYTDCTIDAHFMATLDLYIDLTEEGFLQYEAVLEIAFVYLGVLQDRGTTPYLYEELSQIAEAEFLNEEEEEVSEAVESLSLRLSKYPGPEILTAECLYTEPNPELLQRFLARLGLENLRVYVIAKELESLATETEPWLGTKYFTQPIPSALLARLKSPQASVVLDIPPPNAYICTTFDVLTVGTSKEPVLISKDHRTSVWYKQDHKFGKDIVIIDCYLRCTDCNSLTTPQGKVLGRLWKRIFEEELGEELYPASEAGIDVEFVLKPGSFDINISGFRQKVLTVTQMVFTSLGSFSLLESHRMLFETVKKDLLQNFQNRERETPLEQVTAAAYDLVYFEGRFSTQQLLHALEQITFEDLQSFSRHWLTAVYANWLLMGNFSQTEALELVTTSLHALEGRVTTWLEETPDIRLTQLQPSPVLSASSVMCYEIQSKSSNITNSAVLSLWQVGPLSLLNEALVEMLDQFLREAFFNELRTKEQLGYLVSTESETCRNYHCYKLEVQSNVSCPHKLTQRISQFIDHHWKLLQSLSNNKFKTLKKAVVKNYRAKDVSISDEHDRFSDEVYYNNLVFTRNKQVADLVQKLTKPAFLDFYQDVFFHQNRRLDIEFVGDGFQQAQEESKAGACREYVSDTTSFKAQRGPLTTL
jgi:insulysin